MAFSLVASCAAVALFTSGSAAQRRGATNDRFEVTGNSGVSAQQMFLSTPEKVIVIDKTEGNGNNLNIDGHPAWGTEYDVTSDEYRPLSIRSNTFCAGGNVLGNGTWLNVGGNQAVGPGGLTSDAWVYGNDDGGRAVRLFDPCDDENCEFREDYEMTTRRWYPTLETLEDGSIIIIGGCDFGGYVNDANQNNPTYEFFPPRDGPRGLNILLSTLPANLFPLTFLLPSGNIFINSNRGNEIFDYKNAIEHPIADTPHSVRTYPGSAAHAMLPLTPANNWTATLWFCGGTDLQPDQFTLDWNIAGFPADNSCISMTPDESTEWQDEDDLPEGRSMGNMIALPDGRFVILNGIGSGTAGYGNTSWALGQSFGQDPINSPLYFDPEQPRGRRFSRSGMGDSTVGRLYHSSALLLPDGSIMSSGSNPNADYVAPFTPGYPYATEYRVEHYYPSYYTNPRPQPSGLPETLGYGGDYFEVNVEMDEADVENTKVVLIRPGFSTHAMNMGQRYVQLDHTASYANGNATLFVSQLPPNPAILAPGPCMIFVVVDGTPSIGQFIMIGNGQIGEQETQRNQALPPNTAGSGAGAAPAASASASGLPIPAPAADAAPSGFNNGARPVAASDDSDDSSASTLGLSSAVLLAVAALFIAL